MSLILAMIVNIIGISAIISKTTNVMEIATTLLMITTASATRVVVDVTAVRNSLYNTQLVKLAL